MQREPLSWQKGGRRYCGPLPETSCACGCGRTFDWGAKHRKYYSHRCACRAWVKRNRARALAWKKQNQRKHRVSKRGRKCACGATDSMVRWSNSLSECEACATAARRNGRCPTHKRPYRRGGICPECRVGRHGLIPVIILCEGRDQERVVYRKINEKGQISVGGKSYYHPRDLVVTLPEKQFYRLRW